MEKSKREKYLKIQDRKRPEKSNKVKQGYPCQVCGASFTRKPALKIHIETIHEGKRPHTCLFCALQFMR